MSLCENQLQWLEAHLSAAALAATSNKPRITLEASSKCFGVKKDIAGMRLASASSRWCCAGPASLTTVLCTLNMHVESAQRHMLS